MASSSRLLARSLSSTASSAASKPPHLLSLADLTVPQLDKILTSAYTFKSDFKQTQIPKDAQKFGLPSERDLLKGRTVALMFSKRSTRTRVASESAPALLGAAARALSEDKRAHPLMSAHLPMARSLAQVDTPCSSDHRISS